MALKATVYKAELQVADIDRGYYADHTLTLARHPSETEDRLMVRLLAFAMHAGDTLEFGRGLSTDDEPDLWQMDATGNIEHWLEVGLPDERRLRRAAGRSARVTLIAYGQRAFDVWWQKNQAALTRLDRLTVWSLADAAVAALGALAGRNMTLQCIVQDGELVLSDATASVAVAPELRQRATRP